MKYKDKEHVYKVTYTDGRSFYYSSLEVASYFQHVGQHALTKAFLDGVPYHSRNTAGHPCDNMVVTLVPLSEVTAQVIVDTPREIRYKLKMRQERERERRDASQDGEPFEFGDTVYREMPFDMSFPHIEPCERCCFYALGNDNTPCVKPRDFRACTCVHREDNKNVYFVIDSLIEIKK